MTAILVGIGHLVELHELILVGKVRKVSDQRPANRSESLPPGTGPGGENSPGEISHQERADRGWEVWVEKPPSISTRESKKLL